MQSKKIVWVSSLVLDVHLHKTSRLEMLQALAERGHKVSLIASYSSRRDSIGAAKVQTVLIPLRQVPMISAGAYVLLLFLYLPLFILRVKPDFVVIEPNPTVLGFYPTILFPKSIRPKTVLDIRSTPVDIVGVGGFLKTMFFSISLRIARKSFEGITIITSLMKKEVCERYDVDPKSVGIWTSGVSTTTFRAENWDKTKIRKSLGLEGKFIVFYDGVFGRKRGIAETIKAVGLLKARCPDLVLFLLGNDEINAKRMIRELGIQNMVIVHGRVAYAEVPKYVSMCDVGIVPLPNSSDWRYQCPLNLLEYLSMKKVVIATDIPANRVVLGECGCGIYASSADPREIAKSIVYAYENRKMLRKWGDCGRIIVEERYSWMKVAENFEAYLLQL